MFLSCRQDPSDVQIPYIDLLVRLRRVLFPPISPTTLEHLQLCIGIWCQEERQRIPLLASFIPDSMYRSRKPRIGLLLQILSHVAYKSAWLRRCINPDTVLIQDFQSGNRVLED